MSNDEGLVSLRELYIRFLFFLFLFLGHWNRLSNLRGIRRFETLACTAIRRDRFSALKRLLFLSASRVPNRVTVRFQRGKRGSRLRAATVHACRREIFLLLVCEIVLASNGARKGRLHHGTGNPWVIICPCITCVCAICLGWCVDRVYRE